MHPPHLTTSNGAQSCEQPTNAASDDKTVESERTAPQNSPDRSMMRRPHPFLILSKPGPQPERRFEPARSILEGHGGDDEDGALQELLMLRPRCGSCTAEEHADQDRHEAPEFRQVGLARTASQMMFTEALASRPAGCAQRSCAEILQATPEYPGQPATRADARMRFETFRVVGSPRAVALKGT